MRNRSVDVTAIAFLATVGAIYILHRQKKQQNSKLCEKETDECQSASFPSQETSCLASLYDLMTFLEPLKAGISVEDANNRRSILYHALTTCGPMNVGPWQETTERIPEMSGSQRAAIIMCDNDTSQMLKLARKEIMADVGVSEDSLLRNFHVPLFQVTSSSNKKVPMVELVNRFHTEVQPFQLELDRFVVVGDMIVALWRAVGEHKVNDDVISDRHGSAMDPIVHLIHDLDDFIGEKPGYENITQDNVLQLGCLYHGWIFSVIAKLPVTTSMHEECEKATSKYGGHRWVASHIRFLDDEEVIFDETLPLERDYLGINGHVDANKSFDTHETEMSLSMEEESVATTTSRRSLRVPKWIRRGGKESKNEKSSIKRSWFRRRSRKTQSAST